jgi:hypothetical protein
MILIYSLYIKDLFVARTISMFIHTLFTTKSINAGVCSQIEQAQLVEIKKAHMLSLIEEDRQWREDMHVALMVPEDAVNSKYSSIGKRHSQGLSQGVSSC